MQIELKRIQQRVGTTFIYVTHDQGEALTMSDRIAVMNDGRIEQIGTSEEIYSRPRTRFVARFIGDTNLLDAEIVGREEDVLIVNCQGLHIQAKAGAIDGVDQSIGISIRPEKIAIEAAGAARSGPNCFQGRVKTMTFMGSVLRYEIVLQNEVELLVEEPNQEGLRLKEGDDAVVSWTKESSVVLRDER
jgi:ABC-type Fe3+/spermidine/putrescine transport system ATPase subunit